MTPGEALTVWDFALVAAVCAGAAGYAWLLPRWQSPDDLSVLCDNIEADWVTAGLTDAEIAELL